MIKPYFLLMFSLFFSVSIMAETQTFRLSDFYAGDSIARLEGKSSSVDIAIPLSAISDISKASLRIEIVSSQALVEKRSQMYVRFNNATIGQIAYSPNQPTIISTIDIPSQLWREGFNNLTLAVSQHYAMQCVNGSAPELWSEVNLYTSSLTVDADIDVDNFGIKDLSGFFSAGIGGQRSVQLLTAEDADSEIIEKTLPLVAQALALRNQYQPLSIMHTPIPQGYVLPKVTQQDEEFWSENRIGAYEKTAWYLAEDKTREVHVLVGNKQALSPVLSDAVVNEINGPFLKVQRTEAFVAVDKTWVPASYRLIVSGNNNDEVFDAAKALSVMDDALNPGARTIVRSQTQMDAVALQQTAALQPGESYTFSDIGVSSDQFVDEGRFEKNVSLTLPADFFVPENASVEFLLDFGYGAGIGPGSSMNVNVNGELVHGLYLGDVNGESFRDYQLKIPARFFKGGTNSVSFIITMRPPVAGLACNDVQSSHLLFQFNNSSSIHLPQAGHVAVQPDLGLFGDTGYPLARFNSAPKSQIFIPSNDYLNSALTLAGKLAQVAKIPLLNLSITKDANEDKGSLIVLGSPETLNSFEQDSFVTAIGNTKRWPYRAQNMLYNRVRDFSNDKSYRQMLTEGTTVQESDLGDNAVFVAQRHPNGTNSDTLFLLVAQTPEKLAARVDDLISLSLWGQMAGDFFVWNDNESPLLVMQVNDKYEMGEPDDVLLTLRLWLSNNPWYWLVTFMVLVFFVSLLIYLLLRRRNKRAQDSW